MTETVADILREMREDDVRLTSDDVSKAEKKALKWACDWCKGYANRIDAAQSRRKELTMTSVKPILDACCGSRMFWRDHHNPNVLYCDNRILKCEAIWTSRNGKGTRYCEVMPDIQADFTALPFADESFVHVVFDPPHLLHVGKNAWMAKKYGRLEAGKWRQMIHDGFAECWRVLKPNGTLVFKWNQNDIDFEEVFRVIGREPLYGHVCGKSKNTMWAAFVKLEEEARNDQLS